MEVMKVGPLGGYKYNGIDQQWDETESINKLSHIFVTFDDKYNMVRSIQFGYVLNGSLVLSKKYGGNNTEKDSSRIVRLNHESEFVTGISGEIGRYSSINSLTFHTNERAHEAFHADVSSDNYHPVKMEYHSGIRDRREFGGFFGSYDSSGLCSIGLYVKPILSVSLGCLAVKKPKNEPSA